MMFLVISHIIIQLKWALFRKAEVNLLYIALFGIGGLILVYGIDVIYRKLKNK
jgi:hypothetical protein